MNYRLTSCVGRIGHVIKIYFIKLNKSLIIYMTLGSESMLLFEKHYYNSVTPACKSNKKNYKYNNYYLLFSASYCWPLVVRWKWKFGSEPLKQPCCGNRPLTSIDNRKNRTVRKEGFSRFVTFSKLKLQYFFFIQPRFIFLQSLNY